ncbi:hypothetical protein Taro_044136, partial [Colocasia esculenta]|nr:hypothetical protein [Colocasia esculenta]
APSPLSFSATILLLSSPFLLLLHLTMSTRRKMVAPRERKPSQEVGDTSRATAERRSKHRADRTPEVHVPQNLDLCSIRGVFKKIMQPRYMNVASLEDMFEGLEDLFEKQHWLRLVKSQKKYSPTAVTEFFNNLGTGRGWISKTVARKLEGIQTRFFWHGNRSRSVEFVRASRPEDSVAQAYNDQLLGGVWAPFFRRSLSSCELELLVLDASILCTELRKDGDPHDCLADAEAAMKIVLAKIKHGFDDPIAVEGKKVSEADIAKLLLHRIPIDVPSEDLLKLFPNCSNVTIQPELKISGQTYSTYAVFKDCKEAFDAFEEIKGADEKDSYGRPQKLVSLRLEKSKTIGIYIRKMLSDSPQGDTVTLKRNADANAECGELKRQRTDLHECEGHLKEIERLKQELLQRDEEIFNLQKALSDLMEKGQN